MFHSMAGQAEYIASLAQCLAELVEFDIEYSKFFSVETSQTDGSGQDTKTGAVSCTFVPFHYCDVMAAKKVINAIKD